jgi:SET domain-containing protein
MQKIIVKYSKLSKGRGVFANADIKKGEILEISPLLLLPMKDFELIKKTKLYYYYFEYTDDKVAIALGFGSLYNHSYKPNARYLYDYKNKNLKYKAIKDINEGEEIFINYNYYPNDRTKLEDWFKLNLSE